MSNYYIQAIEVQENFIVRKTDYCLVKELGLIDSYIYQYNKRPSWIHRVFNTNKYKQYLIDELENEAFLAYQSTRTIIHEEILEGLR